MAIALFRNRVMLPFFMLKFTHVAIFFFINTGKNACQIHNFKHSHKWGDKLNSVVYYYYIPAYQKG